MSLIIKKVSMKNFLSIGNIEQTIDLTKSGLSLILGANLDIGNNGARNGVGKSGLLQAISYGLYGQSLTKIRVNNLINNINQKDMNVKIEFEKDNVTYVIERGKKPDYFKYIVNGKSIENSEFNDSSSDDSQGESRETQKEIDRVLGMSHTLFKHIVALNTFTQPFLDLGAAKQREIIEELLSITLLSQKAENLKERIKVTKSSIDQEEFKIKTLKQNNDRVQKSIDDLTNKSLKWIKDNKSNIERLQLTIDNLSNLDIDIELQSHRDLELFKQLTTSKSLLQREHASKSKQLVSVTLQLNSTTSKYLISLNKECPTCGQHLHDHKHEHIKTELESSILSFDNQKSQLEQEIANIENQLSPITEALTTLSQPIVFYNSLEEALNHKNTLDYLINDLEKELKSTNPYQDQIDIIKKSSQDISYEEINKLYKDRDHQEFLLKLLTNKDSFIRKRIIDQNLALLNLRLSDYVERIGLPHSIKVINDLSVEIKHNGTDLDFDSFSRGERTRLVLALSWAFRDVFEHIYHSVNLLFVDELLDFGMDIQGSESGFAILKHLEREQKKNIFVISHKEELINRVESVLTVTKENSFSSFSWDDQSQEI